MIKNTNISEVIQTQNINDEKENILDKIANLINNYNLRIIRKLLKDYDYDLLDRTIHNDFTESKSKVFQSVTNEEVTHNISYTDYIDKLIKLKKKSSEYDFYNVFLSYLYYLNNQYKEALAEIKEATETGTNGLNYYLIESLVLFKLNQYDKAIKAINKCIGEDDSQAIYYYIKAIYLALNGDFESSILEVNSLISIEKTKTDYYDLSITDYYDLSILLHKYLNKPSIIDDFDSIKKTKSIDAYDYYGIGLMHKDNKQYDLFLKNMDIATTLAKENNEDPIAINVLKLTINTKKKYYMEIKDYESAITETSNLLKLDPQDHNLYRDRASFYVELNNYKKAIQDIGKVIDLLSIDGEDSSLAPNYALRSSYYFQIDNHKKAIKDITKAIDLAPDTSLYYYNLRGTYLFRIEKYNSAIDDFSKSICLLSKNDSTDKNSWSQKTYWFRSLCYYYFTSDYDKAIDDLTYLIDNSTNDIDITKYLHNRAESLYFQGNYSKAIDDCNSIISLDPVNHKAFSIRGRCYEKLDNSEFALKDYTKAIELDKTVTEVYLYRGSLLFNDLRYEDALKDLLIVKEVYNYCLIIVSKCYDQLGDYNKAQQATTDYLAKNPDDALGYLFQAQISAKLNDKEQFYYSIERFLASWDQFSSGMRKEIVGGAKFDHKLDEFLSQKPNEVIFRMVTEISYKYTLLLLEILFKLDKNNIINDKYFKLVSFLDSFDENIKDYPQGFSDLYFDIFKERISFDKNSFKIDLKYRFKYNLINHIIDSVFEPKNINNLLKSELKRYVEMLNLFRQLLININGQMLEEIKKNEQQKAKEIADARVRERNEVIAKLSHSVKNLLRSAVIDPLSHMEKSHLYNGKNLSDALKGANLIREIVNGINLSFHGTTDDFYYDAENNSYEPYSLYSMFLDSFKHSVSNMLDGKYFNVFMKQYFPTRDKYQEAINEWDNENKDPEAESILEYINKHLGSLTFNYSLEKDLSIGNQKGSAIKLLILFQEVIFNAIKYSSFVNYDQRIITVNIHRSNNKIIIEILNRYNSEIQAKSSGLGSIIIENFVELLSGEFVKTNDDNIYKVTLIIPDLWKTKE